MHIRVLLNRNRVLESWSTNTVLLLQLSSHQHNTNRNSNGIVFRILTMVLTSGPHFFSQHNRMSCLYKPRSCTQVGWKSMQDSQRATYSNWRWLPLATLQPVGRHSHGGIFNYAVLEYHAENGSITSIHYKHLQQSLFQPCLRFMEKQRLLVGPNSGAAQTRRHNSVVGNKSELLDQIRIVVVMDSHYTSRHFSGTIPKQRHLEALFCTQCTKAKSKINSWSQNEPGSFSSAS